MILRNRKPPRYAETLRRLAHRLPAGHIAAQKIPHQLYTSGAGFSGETRTDQLLQLIRWPDDPLIIRDLYFYTLFPVQIDTLLLFPHYVLVLEIKNFSGILHFFDSGLRMERESHDTGERTGFDSPIPQLLSEMEEIRVLLNEIGADVPVYGAVVLPYAKTLVRGDTGGIPVIHAKSVGTWARRLTPGDPLLPSEDVAALGKAILQRQIADRTVDFQKKFGYAASDILGGVRCSACGRIAERVSQRRHRCESCDVEFDDGFRRTLDDWFDFVKREISVKECQAFLGLKERDAAKYVLKKFGYVPQGETRNRVYRRKK